MSDDFISVMPAGAADDWDRELAQSERSVFSSFNYNFSGVSKAGPFLVLRNCSAIHPVIFFRIVLRRIEILHLYSTFSSSEIRSICKFLFEMFAHVRSVGFEGVESDGGKIEFLAQRYNASEDFVIDLCGSVDQYTNQLGKQLQTDLKRFRKKLCSEFSDVRYEVFLGQDITESAFNEIIAFSDFRMAVKQGASSHSPEKSRRLFELVKDFGFLFVVCVDGKVRGGVICTLYGKDMFMHVVAHDPLFDKFRLGKLACYFSICTAIERGAMRYHLLSGWYEYKMRFLARQVEFDRVEVYRSIGSVFFCFDLYIKIFFRGNARRIKRYLRSRGISMPRWWTEGPGVRTFLRRKAGRLRWLRRGG